MMIEKTSTRVCGFIGSSARAVAASLVVTILACVPVAHAEWVLGLGAGRDSDPYIVDDTRVYPFPIISYETERWTVGVGYATYCVFCEEDLQLNLVGNLRTSNIDDPFSRRDDRERPQFAGIDRDLAFDLGFSLIVSVVLPISIEWHSDVTGAKGGAIGSIGVIVPLFEGAGVEASILIGARWLSQDYLNYNYGIRLNEARPGRAAYESLDDARVPFGSLSVSYRFNERWSANLGVEYERLSREITASPLIEDDHSIVRSLSVEYRF